jgi:dTDP-4-amino-4,6-dideoxygalactose transaminase
VTDFIPWIDLTRQYAALRAEVLAELDAAMSAGAFILGPNVERFEHDFAQYVGAAHCVGLNSGTSALHLALLACGVGPGDEVITTPATWISPCWAISYVGARPVFADIDAATCGLDPNRVQAAITRRTKAILVVHLYGQAAAVRELREIADRHGLVLIEDAAQAHSTLVGGRHAGTFGQAGCFSFYPTKNLGAFGEAGAVVTPDERFAARMRRLRDHAQTARHVHSEIGFNLRMEGLQGTVLGIKLRYLDAWSVARQRIARRYTTAWQHTPGVQLPGELPFTQHGWHLYALRCARRDALAQWLRERGIGTAVHYPTPVHLQPAYRALGYQRGDFPLAERLFEQELSVPLFPELRADEVTRVVDAVNEWAGRAGQTEPLAA